MHIADGDHRIMGSLRCILRQDQNGSPPDRRQTIALSKDDALKRCVQVFHRHEFGHVIGIEALGIDNLLTMGVDDLDRLAPCYPHRATTPSGDNVKVCHHGLVPLQPGGRAFILQQKMSLMEAAGSRWKTSARVWQATGPAAIGGLSQPRWVSKRHAIGPNALTSAGWIPTGVASTKWIPWIPRKNPAWPSRDSLSC